MLADLRFSVLLICAALAAPATAQESGCDPSGAIPMAERTQKSEITRNFIALTVYPETAGGEFRRVPALERFPGWTDEGERVLDSDGGWIYAFSTDESGVGASYYWLLRRAQYTEPKLAPTPRQLAHSMAGVAPAYCDSAGQPTAVGVAELGASAEQRCGRVTRYLEEWLGLAPLYFPVPPGPDQTLDLHDPDELWNWMRVMYHHESGRTPVVDRATFDRGVRLASDYIAAGDRLDRPLSEYLGTCAVADVDSHPIPGDQHLIPGEMAADRQELMQVLGQLDALSASLAALQRQVDNLRVDIERLAGSTP